MSNPAIPAESPRSQRLVVTALVVISALIILGQVFALIRSALSDQSAVPIPRHGPLSTRVSAALQDALGPSDRGAPRFRIIALHHGALSVTWSINNDISNGTLGDGAATDVYDALFDLATLPVTTVRLIGTYPLHGRETVVMRLIASRRLLTLLHSAGSDGLDPQSVWPLLDRVYVNTQFQPTTGE